MTAIEVNNNCGQSSNCLNTIRLLAAIEVLYGHAFRHLQIDAIPVLGDFIYFFQGVPIFFTMSGFLIWRSIGRSRSLGEYLKSVSGESFRSCGWRFWWNSSCCWYSIMNLSTGLSSERLPSPREQYSSSGLRTV